ncbi:hypothetical protein ACF061_09040 [Streptomyces sp. NPDC015220]|uniref:hypothetical protein n=1 Tax=Streptomyces sp. NPDC015220 TaxID=3364947 RepID=UPI003700C763
MPARTARARLIAAAALVLTACAALTGCRDGQGVRDEGPSSVSRSLDRPCAHDRPTRAGAGTAAAQTSFCAASTAQ